MNKKNKISRSDAQMRSGVDDAPAAERDMKMVELSEQAQEVIDLLHALDKIGDGIGGADGFAVSAVAIAARSVAENVHHSLKVMERIR